MLFWRSTIQLFCGKALRLVLSEVPSDQIRNTRFLSPPERVTSGGNSDCSPRQPRGRRRLADTAPAGKPLPAWGSRGSRLLASPPPPAAGFGARALERQGDAPGRARGPWPTAERAARPRVRGAGTGGTHRGTWPWSRGACLHCRAR